MNDEDIKITNDGLDPEFSDDDVVATPPVIGADGDADSDIDLDDDDEEIAWQKEKMILKKKQII